MTPILTFCMGVCNNNHYMQAAIRSVRKYSYFNDSPFIVFAENCNDGSNEWLLENRDKYNLTVYIENNPEDKVKGIGGGQNFCAERATTEFLLFLHADFIVSTNWDLACLLIAQKYPHEKTWVNPYRIQPDMWGEPSRPGTLIIPKNECGYTYANFNEEYFIENAKKFSILNSDLEIRKGEGVSGLIKTKDFLAIKCDVETFRPSFYEDQDLFLRMQLAGYKFIVTSNAVCWHFGSRSATSNFPNDSEFIKANTAKFYEKRSGERFFKKWGFIPEYDSLGFVTFPKTVDPNAYEHLIKIL